MARATEQLKQAMEVCELGALTLPNQVDVLMDAARAILQEVSTLTPPNEPLTSDELREMDGQPVYVVPENEYSELGGWCVISADDSDDYSCALVPGTDYWRWRFEAYGEQWLAYRRPPEGEEEKP